MLPSERIKSHLDAAREFRRLLDELIPLLERSGSRPRPPTRDVANEDDDKTAELMQRGHELAGPAARAFREAQMMIHYRPPPVTGQPGRTVNPAQNWTTIFDRFPMFTPAELRGYALHVEGTLQQEYDEAIQRERGPIGWLARFLLIPQAIREAAGFDGDSAGGRIAFGFGVLVQLAVGLIAGTGAMVLGTAVLRALDW